METPYATDEESVAHPCEQLANHKYHYREFDGFEGERLLKSILRKVLPLALFRTWEILVERQATGNDCYLSMPKLAEKAERVERTIRLNIHELEARKLLVLRPARKLLRQDDGSYKHKLVVVKDFSGLYALALEYLRWTQSEDYIEPDRAFTQIIQADEHLRKKLLRFNNYRRIMCTNVPGPKPREREEHRWYSEYDPATDEQEVGRSGGSVSPLPAGRVEEAQVSGTCKIRKENLQENSQEPLKKDSEERNRTNHQKDRPERDSFDSAIPPERRGGVSGYTKDPNGEPTETGERRDFSSPSTKTNPTNPSLLGLEQDRAGTKPPDECSQEERARAFVQRAMAAYEDTRAEIGRLGQSNAPSVKPNALVSAFIREVSPPFNDQNVKGSLTRVLRAVEHAPLSQKDILACLVKAYMVARETKRVRPEHRHPDGDNKMPLFCTMFARFVKDCASGKFGYTDEHLARDIAADDRLVLFLVEHDLEGLLLEETRRRSVELHAGGEGVTPSEVDAPAPEQEMFLSSLTTDEMRAEEEQLRQQEGEREPRVMVTNPQDGWACWEDAHRWAHRLREHYPYGTNDYGYDVQPAYYEGQPTGRWLFIFYAHRDPQHCWAIYGHKDEVNFHLQSPETIWEANDGVVDSTG